MITLSIANPTDTLMLIFKRDLKAFVRSWVGFPLHNYGTEKASWKIEQEGYSNFLFGCDVND